jgi:mono/diheme cytochrome c family protein
MARRFTRTKFFERAVASRTNNPKEKIMSTRNILIATLMLGAAVFALAACASPTPTATPVPPTAVPTTAAAPTQDTESEIEAPSSGNTTPGPAITQKLTGDPQAGAQIFADNCKKCHGDQGKGGVANPGSDDGTVPPLNPVDNPEGFRTNDPAQFAQILDSFIEHGSTPEGDNPKEVMDAWGDKGKLTPQQIADVIAYIISLNKQ